MRTMYKVVERVYMDCDGHNTMWKMVDNYVATIEEAKEIATKIDNCGYVTGDWEIIAKTIDEEAFEVKEEVVEKFDWWEKVGKIKNATKEIEYCEEAIANIEMAKARCRSEKGIARKDKEIEHYKARIEEARARIAEA